MKAELISIGDEILIGQIVNTNSVFLAKQLNRIGVEINQITSISDKKNVIINTLDDARKSRYYYNDGRFRSDERRFD